MRAATIRMLVDGIMLSADRLIVFSNAIRIQTTANVKEDTTRGDLVRLLKYSEFHL